MPTVLRVRGYRFAPAAAKIAVAFYQIAAGNFSNVKGVGAGVYERKIDFGPGYRVYFGKDGEQLVIPLAEAASNANNRQLVRREGDGLTTDGETLHRALQGNGGVGWH